ncbi:MAG: hypothetical protein ABGX16_20235 [Pirellulales bacterium]
MSIANRSRPAILAVVAVITAVVLLGTWSPVVNAQCTTCATPAVATTPVAYSVYYPVETQQPQTSWYLGRWFDRRRAKRQVTANAVAPTTTYANSSYANSGYAYTAGYQPYTVAYAPTSTVAYRPYVTAYAPLTRTVVARPVVQTVYSPVVSAGCSGCAMPTATLHPVVGSCSMGSCSMGSCSIGSVASSCSSCSAGVSPAVYAAPASSCSSCATTSTGPVYSGSTTNAGISQTAPQVGPQTPQPSLESQPTTPVTSPYKTNRPPAEDSTPAQVPTPTPLPEEKANDTNTTYGAPLQLNPADRSARRLPNRRNQASVEVRAAVYQKPISSTPADTRLTGQNSMRLKQPTQAEISAEGWHSVHH